MPPKNIKKPSRKRPPSRVRQYSGQRPGKRYTAKDFKQRFQAWRRLPPKQRLIRAARFTGVAAVWGIIGLALVGGVTTAIIMRDLPDPERIQERDLAQSTKILDRTGEVLLYEIHGDERRTIVPLEELPDYVHQATITMEDKDFYDHAGFSIRRIFVTAITNVLEGETAGGSTLTQQFVKNSILTPEKTYIRKIKELILSIQIEQHFTKDEILEMYINEIPYGSNAYGIDSAAQTYFAKSARELTLEEAATLAALIQRPTYYWNNQDVLLGRKDYLLGEMASEGYITQEEAESAQQTEIAFQRRREDITAPHFILSYVRPYLDETYGEEVVERGGLTVTTTLDVNHQEWAEEAVASGKDTVVARGGSNAALVSMDTKTKQVLAMVGSFDYFDSENGGQTNAADPPVPRSPGSSLKPLVYATGFEQGFSPEMQVFDLETTFPLISGPWTPQNYDFTERGPVTLRKALQGSLNIPAVKVLHLVGFDALYDNLENLGYTTFTERAPHLSLVLGGGGVKLVEHVYAYSTIAREGEKHPSTSVLKVTDASGDVLEEWEESDPIQAFDREAARTLNSVLSDDSARAYVFGTGSKLTLPGRQVAAKTGTSTDNIDNWTIGYTPSLAAGVWVGNNDNSSMNGNATGAGTAAPIWNAYMRKATEGLPAETFKSAPSSDSENPWLLGQIDESVTYSVDTITGKVIPDDCIEDYPKRYITTKEFKVTHNSLHYVNLKDPGGDPPKSPEDQKYYSQWEPPVASWVLGQPDYLTGEPEYTDCGLRDPEKLPTVNILSPTEGEQLTPETFDVDIRIKPGQNLKTTRVEYYIDDNLVDTQTSSPWTTDYTASSLTSGRHELMVKATNSLGNYDTDTTNFYFDIPSEQTLSITEPKGPELPSNTDEVITLSVTDADAISQITVFESRADTETILETILAPTKNTQTINWNTGGEGSVELYFSITYKAGGGQTSSRTSLTIVP